MTGFWAKMLIFNEYRDGNITKDCAERFVALIEKHELKKVRLEEGYRVCDGYNDLNAIYKQIAKEAIGEHVDFNFSYNLEKVYDEPTIKEDVIKQCTREFIKCIADNIRAISYEQGYRIGNNTVYLEHILGEETPLDFVDREMVCLYQNEGFLHYKKAYVTFDFDKPLSVDEEYVNDDTLNDIATITDYLEHKVKWQKTGKSREYYEKASKRFRELENRCRKAYEENYGDMHGY